MKQRLIEVALWLKSVVAVLAVIWALAITTYVAVIQGIDDGFLFASMFLAIILCVFGVVWTVNYVITGRKFRPIETLQLIFGNVPPYFWFIFFFLYFWAIGSAIWSGVSDSVVFGGKFADGVGVGFAILLLGTFGRLYRPNKFLGHVVGTFIMSILALASYQYTS